MAGNEGKLNDLPGISARLTPPNRDHNKAINPAMFPFSCRRA
jgi:hypothetical protein